jgi:hypothetical protein
VSRAFAAVKEISYKAKLDLMFAQCGNVVLSGDSPLRKRSAIQAHESLAHEQETGSVYFDFRNPESP